MADLREQVKDIMRPAIMNDVTPLPSDVDITAEAAIKVIRERIESEIPEVESHYCDCEYCGKSMREDILKMLTSD